MRRELYCRVVQQRTGPGPVREGTCVPLKFKDIGDYIAERDDDVAAQLICGKDNGLDIVT